MKYCEYYNMYMVPEWSDCSIAYEEMKTFLYGAAAMRTLTPAGSNLSLIDTQPFLRTEDIFFEFCTREISKVAGFLDSIIIDITRRIDLLQPKVSLREEPRRIHSNALINPLHSYLTTDGLRSTMDQAEDVHYGDPYFLSKYQYFELTLATSTAVRNEPSMEDMKQAWKELYLMIIAVKNFYRLNSIGFSRILETYDRLFATKKGTEWRQLHMDNRFSHISRRIDQMMLEMNDTMSDLNQFHVMIIPEEKENFVNRRLRLYLVLVYHLVILGLLILTLVITSFILYGPHSSKSLDWRAGVHLYRSSLLIFLHIILCGYNIYEWSKHGINYVAIFDLHQFDHLTFDKFYEIGTFLLILWCTSFLLFLITFYYNAYPFVQPFIFIILLLCFLFNPIQIFYRTSRRWLTRILARIFLAPFVHVNFSDFWIANQLSSLELVFFDMEFFICFYTNRSNWSSSGSTSIFSCTSWFQIIFQIFLKILPAWFRCAQCLRRYRDTKCKFPDLVNAAKYASGFLVSITNALRRVKNFDYDHNKLENPFFYTWIFISLISSTCKIIWDVKIAWGLLDREAGQNRFLRQQLLHRTKSFYYMAIVGDIILRYLWIINIFIHFESLSAEYSDLLGFSLALAELLRRIMWNSIRLENEQLNNIRKLRNFSLYNK